MADEVTSSFPNWVVYLLIIVILLLIITVTVLVCFVFWRRRKRRRKVNCPEEVPMATSETRTDPDNLQWTPEPGPLAEKYHPIEGDDLYDVYKRKSSDDSKEFIEEFESIPRFYNKYSSNAMNETQNRGKNRFPKEFVGVYDYNRVKLSKPKSQLSSTNYINASFLKKKSGDIRYIATQGPMKETLSDFWRMVWDNNCNIVIMLCDLWRENMELTYQYWPDETSPSRMNTYGSFKVTSRSTRTYADHTVRIFLLENTELEGSVPRSVHQFHYTAWRTLPENIYAKVPEVQSQWMKFITKINRQEALNGDTLAPLVVHCSAGTAESGIFICLDLLKDDLKSEDRTDPYTTLAHLRQQRPNMIHFAGQYQYVFRTLLEQRLYGNTEIDIAEIRNQVFKDQIIRQHLHKEFTSLELISVEVRSTTIGHRFENQTKNRYPDLIIPFDDNLVKISARTQEESHTSYINASWVDSYWEKQAFIITQDPSLDTAPEFWRMLWEHHVTAVVMLTEPGPEPTQCHHYWPHEEPRKQTVTYGNVTIQYDATGREDCPGYSLRTFHISNTMHPETSPRQVMQFHYHDWPDGGVPKYATSLLDMLSRMRSLLPQRQPVAVHCSGGGDRSSVFCALNLSIEQLKDEGKIDVLQTTRLLRHQRQYMIPTEMEYEFIYKAILEYIETYGEIKPPSPASTPRQLNHVNSNF